MIALLLTSLALALAQSTATLTITCTVVAAGTLDTEYLATLYPDADRVTVLVDDQCTIDADHDWSHCATVIPEYFRPAPVTPPTPTPEPLPVALTPRES